jgi:GNAT superfamily N-acetyltransferase
LNWKTLVNFYFVDALFAVKKATPADIPLLRKLSEQIWPAAYNHIIGPTQVDYMLNLFYAAAALEDQIRSGHTFLISYDDDKPVGFASYSEIEPGVYKLHKIYVLPEMQGKGAGKYLLAHIVEELKGKKGATLRLNVNRNNIPALVFYEKAGFKPYSVEDIDIGNGFFMNDYVLELKL